MERVEGWEARTDGPLGPIPFVIGAVASLVIAIVFTSSLVLPAVGWTAFAIFTCILAARAIRWMVRQMEAVQMEREADRMVEREPRLVPLYDAPRWDERKAS